MADLYSPDRELKKRFRKGDNEATITTPDSPLDKLTTEDIDLMQFGRVLHERPKSERGNT